MKELFKKIFPEKDKISSQTSEATPQQSIDEPQIIEHYPIGTKGKRAYENAGEQLERPYRMRSDMPYHGNRSEEYTVRVMGAARNPDNPHKRRLWLIKGEKELDRVEKTGKKLF